MSSASSAELIAASGSASNPPGVNVPAGRSPGGPTPRRRSAQIKEALFIRALAGHLAQGSCEAITDF
jgi:hypothetical protein